MKIQLITQNIKPVGLNAETNSNPILKNPPADSFERQSNVTFKGAATEVAETVVDEALKSKVLASIAKKGEEGLDELCKDMPTFRATLFVLRNWLEGSSKTFWKIADGEMPLPTREKAIGALVENHNNFDNGIYFWNKLWEKGSKSSDFIEKMLTIQDDRHDLIRPIMDVTGNLDTRGIIQPYDLREFQTVEEWVAGFLP